MPVFVDGELVGYAAIKAHWLDIGGKEPYSHRHGRRVPGGHDLPGREALPRGRARRRHLPHRARQLARAEDRRRRHQRRDRRRAHRRRGARRGSSSATASSASASASSACSTHGEAVVRRWFERHPRRPLRRPRRDGRRTASTTSRSRSRSSSRSTARTCGRLLGRARRSGRADQLPAARRPSPRAASRSRCSPAAARRRTRATSAPIDVVTRPGTLFHPLQPAPCFLYGWAGDPGDRGRSTARSRDALPEAVPACSGGDICALVWWGDARGDGRAVDRRRAAPDRPGRARRAATARAA